MAQVKDNPVTEGLSGKLGKRLVMRHMRDGRTIVATRPDYTGHEWTPGQQAHHSRFQEAAAYARLASKTNPLYAAAAAGTSRNAYNLALSDRMKPPVIHEIALLPGCLRVHASDNLQVTEVRITVSDEQGRVLEQGQAVQVDGGHWEYPTTASGRVLVRVVDPAGNVTRREL